MMTDPKIVAEASLPAANALAYTVPDGKAFYLSVISLVNTHAADAKTINVYITKFGGTPRRIAPKDHSLVAGAAYYVTAPYALSSGDEIGWDASSASIVDGVISGTEVMSQ